MIELQLLNYILEKKSISLLRKNKITREHFVTYASEADFLFSHYEKYGAIPDKETFIERFTEFDLFLVSESETYMIETMHEQYLYNQMVPFVNHINELVTEDSDKAIKFAKERLGELAKLNVRIARGYDIIENAKDRGDEYRIRLEAEGLLGITTGIPEFDEITHGWLPGEELVIIVGRTNEGKTWVLLFFLVAAWQAGKKVLLYSGEMPKDIVGFRVDTLNKHFSHTALTTGSEQLGDKRGPQDYYDYLNGLSTGKDLPPFIVITPKDLGGKRLDIPTLEELIEEYQPDIVGIDQLSLMEDYRAERGQQDRLRFSHISEDLYLSSEKYGVPILAPSQASREAAKKKDDDEETPELHEIAESDGIPQNATRVIGMRQINNTLKLTVRKSRYSKKGSEILVLWDIDTGTIKPFLQVDKDKNNNVVETRPTEQSGMSGEELF